MSTKTKQTAKPPKPPKLVGVYMRPREEHWAEVLASAEASRTTLAEGQTLPATAALPKPRLQPVYETEDGQRVLLEQTPGGFVTKPFTKGELLEVSYTGGVAGGFLPTGQAPPLPIAGGLGAMDWAKGYAGRVPEHVELGHLQGRWRPATQEYVRAVDEVTSPERDEWRRKYFARIRETAERRDPIYRSANAKAKGPRYFMKGPKWREQEYHGNVFQEFASAAEQERRDTAEMRTAAPRQTFRHAATGRRLALAGALQKNGPGYGQAVYTLLAAMNSDSIADALQSDLEHKLGTFRGRGGALGPYRTALQAIDAMKGDDAAARLAALWKRQTGRNGGRAPVFSPAIQDLTQSLIGQIGGSGQDGGSDDGGTLASLLSGDNAGAIASALGALAGLLGSGGSGGSPGGGAAEALSAAGGLLEKAPGKLIDQAFDKLLGQVDDRSPVAKQLLAKYQSQIKRLLGKALSGGGLADLKKQWDAIWKSMPSGAIVPFGLAEPMAGADMVLINGLPATRLGDICKWPDVPDAGPFFQGNPTILVNGMPPAGDIHAAKGAAGTIGTPLVLSPNVLMGQTTVSLKIEVETESPAAESSASAPAGAAAQGSGASGVGSPDTGAPPADAPLESKGPDPQDAEDLAAGARAGAEEHAKQAANKAKAAEQQRLDGEAQNADDALERAKGEAQEARARADEADRLHQAEARNAQTSAEHMEAQRTAQAAEELTYEADRADAEVDRLKGEAAEARAHANRFRDLPTTKPELSRVGKIARNLGIAGDLWTTGEGVHQMREAAKKGDSRGVAVAAGGTAGDLAGGFAGAGTGAAAGAAIGSLFFGVGAVPGAVIGGIIGSIGGGWGGRLLGEWAGEEYADHKGYR